MGHQFLGNFSTSFVYKVPRKYAGLMAEDADWHRSDFKSITILEWNETLIIGMVQESKFLIRRWFRVKYSQTIFLQLGTKHAQWQN